MANRRQTIFVEPVQLGDVATNLALPGNPASNVSRLDMIGLTWRIDGSAPPWLRGQLAGPTAISFCSVIAANALPRTQDSVRLGATQAQVDGGHTAIYDSGALAFIAPAIESDDGLYHSHVELGAIVTAADGGSSLSGTLVLSRPPAWCLARLWRPRVFRIAITSEASSRSTR